MAKTYECERCGLISAHKDHLCEPVGQSHYCSEPVDKTASMCRETAGAQSFGCARCGRMADEESLLCAPKAMPDY